MTRLSEILDQMTTVLNDLKTVMDAEQQQLSDISMAASYSVLQKKKLFAGDP
jgi:flagella synthesis protein FlgN